MPENSKANRGPSAGPANRAALIKAAREVFAESGLDAPLSAVARRAGVGQGSLYRHFPDRIALGVAVFDDNIAQLEALAAASGSTLVDLFDGIAEQAMSSTALIELTSAARHDERAEHLASRMTTLVDALVIRDRASGRIREQVTTEDVMLAIGMLAFLLAKTDADDRAHVAERARGIFRMAFTEG
ncbi:helix-turn-helix domain-containing protein [Leifsonia sp. YIM 134122]|uniref:Helix-turn-helix domain-containing protein n=1 Tax=Leifsonia stereocauli TaxID=3134136 RepID=A0ABU9W482_9MICO